MKILIVNTAEKTGGAAIAAKRLTDALNNAGADATMLVMHPASCDKKIITTGHPLAKKVNFLWERVCIWANNLFSRKNLFTVSIANSGCDITKLPAFEDADIIHLHWVNQGFLSLKSIERIARSGKPIVWTMHDMWPCTAICHHAHGCENFKSECRNCRFLRFPGDKDLSNRIFRKKKAVYDNACLNIVTVSRWLAQQTLQSALLKEKPVSVIPNTLSLTKFRNMGRAESRRALGLPENGKIILFGAARIDDPIKGFPILLQALQHLAANGSCNREELHLVTFGQFKNPVPQIPIACTHIGWVGDTNTLSRLYSAANVVVSASLYETFGQTLIEALACGCLPVSFGNSGQADIITHKVNGFLADYLSPESLAEGISWCIDTGDNTIDKEKLRNGVVERYSDTVVAAQYLELYRSIL